MSITGKTQTDFLITKNQLPTTPDSVGKDVVKLTNHLIHLAKNDLEKVSNIYQWIVQNIHYDQKAFKNGNRRINRSNTDILERKKAICWGYSSLFKAMCEVAAIPCEIISGYGKTSLNTPPNLESPNHAWNSVKIDSSWYLLDATWDSNLQGKINPFEQKFGHSYFLTPPKYFIVNHLPANPEWQLLDCLISIKEYQLNATQIALLAERTDCETAKKEIPDEYLSIFDKRLLTAVKAYEYNPTKLNRRELAHAQLDYEAYLTEVADSLQEAQAYDSLLVVQQKMINLCETAAEMTQLFDSQLENCAYNYFNYAITLTQATNNAQDTGLQKWTAVVHHLETAQKKLKGLPQNFFTKEALARCVDYIDYAKTTVESLK